MDVAIFILISTAVICELTSDALFNIEGYIWTLFAMILTVALCVALRRVRIYSASFSTTGIEGRKLLMAHQISFVAAASFNFLDVVLTSIRKIE